jgi:hypothetical protein
MAQAVECLPSQAQSSEFKPQYGPKKKKKTLSAEIKDVHHNVGLILFLNMSTIMVEVDFRV